MTTPVSIDLASVQNFIKWASIGQHGLVECHALAVISSKYVRVDHQFGDGINLQSFAERHIDKLITVGVNPRKNNQWEAAKDKDIDTYLNCYIDIEPIHPPNTIVTQDDRLRCREFVDICGADWFAQCIDGDLVVADSGNGYHVCIAIPAYDNPMEFGNKLQTWYKTKLLPDTKKLREHYNVRIDSTFSPSRQCKLYGTRKPIEGARLSSFPNAPRVESAAFRDYILSFAEKAKTTLAVGISLGNFMPTLEDIEAKYGLIR